MLCLGLSGGWNLIHENPDNVSRAFLHDGAAALVEDGALVAAIEEERLDRIKHSNKFPVRAIQFCLERRGIRFDEVDRIAYYATEDYCNSLLSRLHLAHGDASGPPDVRSRIGEFLRREFDCDFDPARIVFVRHHLAHAVSAYSLSGFERSLILAIDAYGDFHSGLAARADRGTISEIEAYPESKSLGALYLEVIRFLGYRAFDEYKVMGLAPYGNPAALRHVLRECYSLLPDGGYELFLDRVTPALLKRVEIRRRGQAFTQQHRDLAAALQESIEQVVFHVLRHLRRTTDERRLCLSGGVAQNSTMAGKVLSSGLFEEVFVPPAAHDAGCAIGAALLADPDGFRPAAPRRLLHANWGSDIGSDADVEARLKRWSGFLTFERPADVARRSAQLLADGMVVGWVQGRSEFGPRALGNRSILADPRPAANKDRINEMVKKREAYRPFAPAVLVEAARDYFDLPEAADSFRFMTFVVDVLPVKRGLLGAVTHVDGTARVQTVSDHANPRFRNLLLAFRELTGIPVLLNTSFNNHAEPIVETVDDSIACFLTTGIDRLVVGDFVAAKADPGWERKLALRVSLPAFVRVERRRHYVDPHLMATGCFLQASFDERRRWPISADLCDRLMRLDAETTIGEFLGAGRVEDERCRKLMSELEELWSQRLVRLRPEE